MKRFILSLLLAAVSIGANAQFSPNTVLTAAALNAALAAPTITAGAINGTTAITTSGAVAFTGPVGLGANATATTGNYLASSTGVATSAFVRQSILAASAAIPIAIVGGGGTYNFASIGINALFGVTTSGGALATISGIITPGTGYQVGDCLVMLGGNGDAVVYVTAVSGGGITAATVLYGGSGYSGTPQLAGAALPPGSRTGLVSGTLTSNALVIVPSGTFLAGARRFGFANNTTGAFTVTIKLSNGAGGSTGTGVVLPQGTANNTSLVIYTDGVNDLWPEVGSAPSLIVANSLTVGGVAILPNFSATSASLGGSNLATGACAANNTTVAGATTAMAVNATPTADPGTGFWWYGFVASANTVTVRVCSALGGMNAPTATTYKIRVIQ